MCNFTDWLSWMFPWIIYTFNSEIFPMIAETSVKKASFVIEWRDGFKIVISKVDQEHRHLIKLVG